VAQLVFGIHRPDWQGHPGGPHKMEVTKKELHNLAERMAVAVAWLGFFPRNLHKLTLRVACPC